MGLFGIFQNYAAYGRLTLVHMGPIHVGLEYRIRSCKVTATGLKLLDPKATLLVNASSELCELIWTLPYY